MPLRLDPDDPKNIEFLEFVIGKIKAKQDQEMPNFVEIAVQKDVTVFPVFEKIKPSGSDYNIAQERMMDDNKAYDQEAEQIGKYLLNTFKENIEMRTPMPPLDNPLALNIIIVVKNLHGIYMVEEKLKKQKSSKSAIKEKTIKVQNISLPVIEYDSPSGLGRTNGKKFKLKDDQPDYAVFAELYKKAGKVVAKGKILELSGYVKNDKGLLVISDTEKSEKYLFSKGPDYFINELAKKIREVTFLSGDYLVVNNGNITLRAERVKIPPKSPQTTPKV